MGFIDIVSGSTDIERQWNKGPTKVGKVPLAKVVEMPVGMNG